MSGPDLAALALYAGLVLLVGWRSARTRHGAEDLLLAGRELPAWAALVSLVATELSAATFLGVPEASYRGDWSYLELAFGALLAKGLVAALVLPLYHRLGVVTVYGFLEHAFGPRVRRAAAACFVLGRVFASGSRLFIAGLALAAAAVVPVGVAIVLLAGVAGIYTRNGGLRSVVATDVLQAAVLILGAGAAVAVLGASIPGGWVEVFAWAEAGSRSRVFHLDPFWGWASSRPFGVGLVGGFALTLATHATDHDMVQRLLATRDARGARRALVGSALANFPITVLFLALGTGLARFYAGVPVTELGDAARIVPQFALHELPAGVRGLLFAGLAAAAMSSFDSAACAIAAAWVVDWRPGATGAALARRTRRAATGACLAVGAAALAVAAYHGALRDAPGGGPSLVELALSSMTLVYGGLLGIFAVGLLAPGRYAEGGALLGLGAGAAVGLALFLHPLLLGRVVLAWPWWIPLSASIAAGIVLLGPRQGDAIMRSCSR